MTSDSSSEKTPAEERPTVPAEQASPSEPTAPTSASAAESASPAEPAAQAQQPVEAQHPTGTGSAEPARTGRRRWTGRKTLVLLVAAALVVIAAGGGVIYATSGGGSHSDGRMAGGHGRPGQQPGGRGPGGLGGPGAIPRAAVHGDFVVPDGNGGYLTERRQTGKVTQLSATSVAVSSPDGFMSTYVVDAATRVDNGANKITDVKTGDTVTVLAKVSGGSATATSIADRALGRQFGQGANGFEAPGGFGQGAPGSEGRSNG